MKKRKLETEIQFDFTLLGLITSMKEYTLAWHINKTLEVELVKEKDIEIEFVSKSNILISNYLHHSMHCYYRILRNKSINQFDDENAYIVPELRRFDFLLLAKGYEDTVTLDELKKRIGSIPKVQFVQAFAVDKLKSRENLIF
jgi:hypothetical protein